MRNLAVVAVTVEDKDVIVSLLGGDNNVVGTIRFFEKNDILRHDLRRRAEALVGTAITVDLACNVITQRWRLIGPKAEYTLGGLEPTKLDISQTVQDTPKPPTPKNHWGLEFPWMDEEF